MKLDAYKQLNSKTVKEELKLVLTTANDQHEYPDDGDRFRGKTYKDYSAASCKNKLLKQSLVSPFKAMELWLQNRPVTEVDAYTPRELLPYPQALWDNYVSDTIAQLEAGASPTDIRRMFSQVCALSALINNEAKHKEVNENQRHLDWLVTSRDYVHALLDQVTHLERFIYDNYYSTIT